MILRFSLDNADDGAWLVTAIYADGTQEVISNLGRCGRQRAYEIRDAMHDIYARGYTHGREEGKRGAPTNVVINNPKPGGGKDG